MENTGLTKANMFTEAIASEEYFEVRLIGGNKRLREFQYAVLEDGKKVFRTVPLKEIGIKAKENALRDK